MQIYREFVLKIFKTSFNSNMLRGLLSPICGLKEQDVGI